MARRFNLDLDMDLALEAYDFDTYLFDMSEVDFGFGGVINPALAPQTLFSAQYAAYVPFDASSVLEAIDGDPLEAPQLSDQPLHNGAFGAVFELSSLLVVNGGDGSLGTVFNGIDNFDNAGRSVSNAGDVNGDGFDDFIIGARGADANGLYSGESYVVFGNNIGFGASFDLSTLNGTNGFVIKGIDGSDYSGDSVSSAGDVNGDGFDDIIIGAPEADPNGSRSGESYVIFGSSAPFTASIELSALDGTNGFVVNGINFGDLSGSSVSSAGDINGDGFDDIVIGARGINGTGNGSSYVVFGSNSAFAASLELSALDGANGFVINGLDVGDRSGWSVSSAGDINGDGFDDVIIGVPFGDPGQNNSGESYIIFGSNAGFGASFDPSALNGINGFVINGININGQNSDTYTGHSVSSAGDINGDGINDIVIGAFGVDTNGLNAGESYVVFGKAASFGASFDLTSLLAANGGDGTEGFIIRGVDPNDRSGVSVSSAGDVNGDGFDDILIGASRAAGAGSTYSRNGESYVIFGSDASFGASIDLANLNGASGFVINGIDSFDASGYSVSSAGDVNGDGFDDIIIGAYYAAPNGVSSAGETYLIYGQANSEFELSSLLASNGGDGGAGFVLNGIDGGDISGYGVASARDINGDGFDDILIGARNGDPNGSNSGESYVIFGTDTGFGASLELSSLNGTNGFVINGIDASDQSGRFVSSAGDINGDGFDDILIGATFAAPNGSSSGESYVVFGQLGGFGASLDLSALNGSNGFVINGIDAYDLSGSSVSSAGDINGDGFDDILIGAYFADPNGSSSGESYVVFGRASSFGASFDLSALDGNNGFVLNGIDANDFSGASISSAGDINGDGFDDILIGAPGTPNGSMPGESYVVFGSNSPFAASLELSSLLEVNGGDGSLGFVINGIDAGDNSGFPVSSAGDINGDGFDDIVIGANRADPNGEKSGESYVVFGHGDGFSASLDLSALDGTNGFVLNGIHADDYSGNSVSSAGDINGDGFDDILIGANRGDTNGVNSGESYVIFGQASGFSASLDLSSLNGSNGIVINGIDADDQSGLSASSAGDMNGDGYDDILIGAFNADSNGYSSAGESYVIYGRADFGRTVEILSVANDSYTASDNGEVVYGLAGNDVINGGTASDVLIGDEGDDTLSGNDGNDRLEGGAGDDVLDGGNGQDIAVYSGSLSDYDIINNGDGTYTVTDNINGNDVDTLTNIEAVQIGTELVDLSIIPIAINGTAGNDSLMGTVDDDVINGLAGNDIINGLVGNDTINGGDGADRLIGGDGADALNGGAGFDSVDFRGAASGVRFNVVTGGTVGEAAGDTFSGIERYYLSNFNDIITGSAANEFFFGGDGNDQINGGGGIDRIYGGDGDDIQRGQDGNDTLYGSGGADQLNGGAGFDIANYSNAAGGVHVSLAFTGLSGDGDGDTYFGIEAVYGSDFNDFIYGNASANELRGGDGNDSLNGEGGNDRLYGGAGGDFLEGGSGTDIAVYTTANSGVGVNLVSGGTTGEADGDFYGSIEWVWGSNFDDSITGDAANNRLEGRSGNDTLNGEGGNDRLLGGEGNDIINGGDGVDTIFGQDGDDTMTGGAGNDFFFGGAGADSHDGGAGTDTVSYLASGPIAIQNGIGVGGDAAGDSYTDIERYFGSSGDDIINASGVLLGNGGNDYLLGMNGSNDSLNGGAGLDTFAYDATGGAADVIQGFFLGEQISILGGDPNFDTEAEVLAVGTDVGANVIFDFGGGNTLTLVGVNLADLPNNTFTFEGPLFAEPLDNPDAFAADVLDVFDMDALI